MAPKRPNPTRTGRSLAWRAAAVALSGLVAFSALRGCPREPTAESVHLPPDRPAASSSPRPRVFDPLDLIESRLKTNLQMPLHPSLRLHPELARPFLDLIHRDITSPGEASGLVVRFPDGTMHVIATPSASSENDLALFKQMRQGKSAARQKLLRAASDPDLCKNDAVRSLLKHLLGNPNLHRSEALSEDAEHLFRSEVTDQRSESSRPARLPDGAQRVAGVHVHDNGTSHSTPDVRRVFGGMPEYVVSFSPKTGRAEVFHYGLEHGQTRLGSLGTPQDHRRIALLHQQTQSRPPILSIEMNPETGKSRLRLDDDLPLRAVWHHDGKKWQRYPAKTRSVVFDRFDGLNPEHHLIALDRSGNFLSLHSDGQGGFEGQGNF